VGYEEILFKTANSCEFHVENSALASLHGSLPSATASFPGPALQLSAYARDVNENLSHPGILTLDSISRMIFVSTFIGILET